ncbi:MAG: hypothetical protein K9G70_07620 [Prolixibacteraceae bacterium]|nr:hypothetical protein [Prolixibacteraceae bacterium]
MELIPKSEERNTSGGLKISPRNAGSTSAPAAAGFTPTTWPARRSLWHCSP